MHLERFFYKILNLVCRADITRVLVLDVQAAPSVPGNNEVQCRWIGPDDLDALIPDEDFQVRQSFVDDFKRLGFRGVSATNNGQIAGVLFLVPDSIAARHNSGGSPFKGIGLNLPAGVFYLFKVAVKPECRGMKINAQMMAFAVRQLTAEGLDTIVTTTDWTNQAFLRSVENYGFRRNGLASELVVAGRHLYQLPEVKLPSAFSSDQQKSGSAPTALPHNEHRVIKFTRA